MADFTVTTGRLRSSVLSTTARALKMVLLKARVDEINSSLSFEIKQKSNISKNLRTISTDISNIKNSMSKASSVLNTAASYYENAESENCSKFNIAFLSVFSQIATVITGPTPFPNNWQNWIHQFFGNSPTSVWNAVQGALGIGVTSLGGTLAFFQRGASGKAYANWKDGIGAEGEANFSAISGKGSISGPFGIKGNGSFNIGNAAVKGSAKASLYDANGRINPRAEISAEAQASVAKGEINAQWGKANVGASGEALAAKANASASISTEGISAKAGAEAYLAKGEVHGGFSILGIQVNTSASGGIGGAGASAEFSVGNGDKVKIGAGLGFLFGGDVSIELDFSEIKSNIANFFHF